jgi:hypothetical protein
MLTIHVFQKVHTMLTSKSSTVYHQISEVLWINRHNLSSIKKVLKYSHLLLCWGILNVSKWLTTCTKVFSYCLLYGPCIIYVYFVFNSFFVCYVYSILKKYLSVVLFCLCCFVVAAFICLFCIFMTYSTSCCCYYKLMDPWNVRAYVCMYVFLKGPF